MSAGGAPPRPPRALLAGLGALLVALTATAAALFFRARAASEPPLFDTVPGFGLTRHDGSPLRLEDLAGAPWVADFIFTRCGGVCPGMTARLGRLGRERPGLRLVSFTVDPEHDTPEVLAAYAARFEAGPGWSFVTGDKAALYRLATGGFKLAAFEVPAEEQQAGGDGPFLHSAKFVLVDAAGRIRGYYDSDDEAALTRLRADLDRLGP